MKILICNPLYTFSLGEKYEKYFIRSGARWPHSGIKRKGTTPHYLPFPFFLAYSAAWLKREGFEVAALDCVALGMSADALIEAAKTEKPDLCFFETATPTIKFDLETARRLKAALPGSRMILGGPHTTVYDEEALKAAPEVDFIIRGEYEEALVELAKALRGGGDPAGVGGIAYRGADGNVVSTAPRGLVEPLDKLPMPAYDMFPSNAAADPGIYWDGFCQHRPAIQMHASRGCPYKCDFCLWNQVMYGNGRYRTFSPARLVEEVAHLHERYGAKEIYFDDDDFTINAAHVRAIAEGLMARGLKIKWSCMGDAINMTPELLELMARSGCVGMKFGVETGSERMIKKLGKPVNLQKVRDLVKLCARHRIKTHATFTLGLAEDDLDSIRETISFLEDFDCDTIQVSVCTPLPGTRFFKTAEAENLLKTKDWEKYDGKAGDVVKHRNLDLEVVAQMRSQALKRWFLKRLASPTWLLRQAGYFFRILSGIGPAFIYEQARSIIEEEFLIPRNLAPEEKGKP